MAPQAAEAEENVCLSTQRARTNTAMPRPGSALQILASLLWVPQAAFIVVAVGDVASGRLSHWCTWAPLAVLMIGVLRAVLDGIGSRLAFLSARKLATNLRLTAVAALEARSPLDINRPEAGKAASVIAEQADLIVPYVARFEIAKVRAVVVPLILLCFVLWFSWAAALVLVIAAPLIPVFMALIGWKAQEASEAQLVKTGDMNAFLLDRLRGIATIRALGAVDVTANRIRANAEALRIRTMTVLRIAFLSSAVLELFAALGVAMVAVYVGFYLLGQLHFGTWGTQLGLGEGLFILLLAPAFFEPLRDLSMVWHDRASGRAAMEELNRLSNQGQEILGAKSKPGAIPTSPSAPGISVNSLTFRHERDGAPVFDRSSLSIASGEHVALLGPSGSGKSTLLGLLTGVIRPTSGTISIDGRVLTEDSAADIRTGIAWIGQHPHIFAGTFASNVALGRSMGREQIAKALTFAKIGALAKARGASPIGENGVGLSGGEALRLAIARIAMQPRVGLILADEPTAHLDAATAADIVDSLIALARGKTMIIATHDLTLARRMDRIVRLDDSPLEEAA
ncbi:MAG TPA: thiol reductant ABC exporter subunit CydD [Hyphomicrobium sp.]|nr:thiol reductant ABC exporter subunit CydD [Hyphomicrobium sp.]